MSQAQANTTHLRIGTLIDGTGGPPQRNVVMTIQGERIASIRPDVPTSSNEQVPTAASDSTAQSPPDQEQVVDLRSYTVIPGFIDTHVHLVFNAAESHEAVIAELMRSSRDELLDQAIRNAQDALKAGITTLRDCGDASYITLELRDMIHKGEVQGPRLHVCGPPITIPNGHLHFCGLVTKEAGDLRRFVQESVHQGVDHIKVMATGGNMTKESNARRAQFSLEELQELVDEAHRHGKPTTAHVLGTEGIRNAVRAGIDSLEHCTWLAPDAETGMEYDPRLVDEMAAKGVFWGNTLTGIFRTLIHGDRVDFSRDQLLLWCRHFRRMYDAGVKMMLSSDAGVRITRFDDFATSLQVAVQFMEISEMAAIEAATRIPAQCLRMDDVLGTLQPGKLADLVVLEANPLDDITNVRRVHSVYKGGASVSPPLR